MINGHFSPTVGGLTGRTLTPHHLGPETEEQYIHARSIFSRHWDIGDKETQNLRMVFFSASVPSTDTPHAKPLELSTLTLPTVPGDILFSEISRSDQ